MGEITETLGIIDFLQDTLEGEPRASGPRPFPHRSKKIDIIKSVYKDRLRPTK